LILNARINCCKFYKTKSIDLVAHSCFDSKIIFFISFLYKLFPLWWAKSYRIYQDQWKGQWIWVHVYQYYFLIISTSRQNLVRIQRIILQQIENSQSCCKIKIMGKIYVIFIELCMKGNTFSQLKRKFPL
jgi:hypothetical protein